MCCVLFELSTLYLLHKASRLIGEPGNLSLAKASVSTTFSLINFSLPSNANSLFKWDNQIQHCELLSLLFSMKLKNSSTISENFFWVDKNSSV